MSKTDKVRIDVDALRIGHYVDLERSWMDHPFLFSRFRISSSAEIAAIRELGVKQVTVLPERSDSSLFFGTGQPERRIPPPAPAASAPEAAAGATKDVLWDRKQELIRKASGFRDDRNHAANHYRETVKKINTFAREVRISPANAVLTAEEIVEEMAAAFDKESSVLLNLVNLQNTDFTIYSHALNVTVLSLLLGRFLGLGGEDLRVLGMGAIVHDIGKIEIPTQITNKTAPLTPAEDALMRTHTKAGSKLAQKIHALPQAVIDIIEQHHEALDGSGYPQGLQGEQISPLVRIVALANTYDNLCNPPDPNKALSPRDAMAILFKNHTHELDAEYVNKFILAMGVYPPGTVVQLSDDNIGMVVSVDPDQLLRPCVILYNPDIPRSEALMIDLREQTDLQIRNVMKPRETPLRIYEYLGISDRLGFFYKGGDQKS